MEKRLFARLGRGILRLTLLAGLFLSAAPSVLAATCDSYSGNARTACYLKENFVLQTTTYPNSYYTNPGTVKNWFVAGDSTLNTYLKCDGTAKSTSNYYLPNPCGLDTNRLNDIIKSDDLDDDSNFTIPDKEFFVKASTAANSGVSVSSILIEWTNTPESGKAVAPTTWQHSASCSGSSCKICRVGTLCSGGSPVIPVEDISVLADGGMNVLWFKVTLTASNGVKVVVGNDNTGNQAYTWTSTNKPRYMDKYYQLQICNKEKCVNSCTGTPPSITNAWVTNSNCANSTPYTFNWTSSVSGQSEFILNVYDSATGYNATWEYHIISAESGTTHSYTPPFLHLGSGGLLDPNHKYFWEIRTRDNNSNTSCRQWSTYWTGDFTTTCNICNKTAPTISASSATSFANMCNGGLTCNPCNYYNLSWTYANMPAATTQTSATVYWKNCSTCTVNSKTIAGSAQTVTSSTLGMGLGYNQTYYWKVVPTLSDGASCSFNPDSSWKTFTTPSAPPSPVVSSIKNASGECSSVTCRINENITFTGTGAVTGSPTYKWTITDKGNPTTNPYTGQFTTTGTKTATLSITDNGYTCTSAAKTASIAGAACQDLKPASLVVTAPSEANLCTGLSGYTLSWGLANQGDGIIDSYVVNFNGTNYNVGTNTSWTVPAGSLAYGASYPWNVTVNAHNASGCTWAVTSANSTLAVPAHYVDPNITISNDKSENCLAVGGTCHAGSDTISFNSNTSAYASAGTTYSWKIAGTPYTSSWYTNPSYSYVFGAAGTYSATLSATEGGHTCTETKNLTLNGPECSTSMTVLLDNATNGDFCSAGLNEYRLYWTNNNVPAGYTQKRYKIHIRDTDTMIDTVLPEVYSAVESYHIIDGAGIDLQYDKTYDWMVEVYFENSAAGCTESQAFYSPWSNTLGKSFNTPVRAYPTPQPTVTNLAGTVDCTNDGCAKGELLKFDASGSTVSPAPTTYTYTWIINGTTYYGMTVNAAFVADSVTYKLIVQEDPSGPACQTSEDTFALGKTKIRWSEVAP